jgi:hypothetical protein
MVLKEDLKTIGSSSRKMSLTLNLEIRTHIKICMPYPSYSKEG